MINRVTIIITSDGFILEGKLDNGRVNSQHYQVVEAPYSHRMSGEDWCEVGLSDEFRRAADQAVIATARIARNFNDGLYSDLTHITIDVGCGLVDCQVTTKDGESVLLHYSWDENAQMNEPVCLSGEMSKIPELFLNEFHDAVYGRLGLLSRTMYNAAKVTVPMDDMGALRWA